jgi:hypothetical protein
MYQDPSDASHLKRRCQQLRPNRIQLWLPNPPYSSNIHVPGTPKGNWYTRLVSNGLLASSSRPNGSSRANQDPLVCSQVASTLPCVAHALPQIAESQPTPGTLSRRHTHAPCNEPVGLLFAILMPSKGLPVPGADRFRIQEGGEAKFCRKRSRIGVRAKKEGKETKLGLAQYRAHVIGSASCSLLHVHPRPPVGYLALPVQ